MLVRMVLDAGNLEQNSVVSHAREGCVHGSDAAAAARTVARPQRLFLDRSLSVAPFCKAARESY